MILSKMNLFMLVQDNKKEINELPPESLIDHIKDFLGLGNFSRWRVDYVKDVKQRIFLYLYFFVLYAGTKENISIGAIERVNARGYHSYDWCLVEGTVKNYSALCLLENFSMPLDTFLEEVEFLGDHIK